MGLGPDALQNPFAHDSDSAAQDIRLFHRMSCQNHGSVRLFLTVLEDVPQLATGFRV